MYTLIVLLPLVGFLIAGLFGRVIGDRPSEIVTTALMGLAAVLSWVGLFTVGYGDGGGSFRVLDWITSGDLDVAWSLRIDALTVVMLVVVNTVSFLVHAYSIGYMHHDGSRPRFFAYLSLFTFAMLTLVTADNLVQMFFGWEGVGLASYLLIGFWHHKSSANAAAMKAFIVNRVGDFGFILGIFGCYVYFGSVQFDVIFAGAETLGETRPGFPWFGNSVDALTVICLLLFLGAMGKSAQVPLHTWLPDAMEGPTPVSALIHAATMVTAGVFMVARMSPLFEQAPAAMTVVLVVGGLTAIFAATIGLVQNDIKRVIAYSTCSQLGYMFVALGVGAWSVAIFHLFTHAFFKALLFLGAGSVIHAVSDEQDMRRMGGLRKHIPKTYWMMIIGTLALTGVGIPHLIGFAGFYSKDAIIEAAFFGQGTAGLFAFWMVVIAALLTSFYSWRLIFMTFHGKPRASAEVMSHIHESPPIMLVPLYVLAVGAVLAGIVFYPVFAGDGVHAFWATALADHGGEAILDEMHHHIPELVYWAPFIMTVAGFALAYWLYIAQPHLPGAIARAQPLLYDFLLKKWYFDELYDFLFVRPAKAVGRFLWKRGDEDTINRFGPDGIASATLSTARGIGRLQSGYLYHYAFAMLIGVAVLITYFMFRSFG